MSTKVCTHILVLRRALTTLLLVASIVTMTACGKMENNVDQGSAAQVLHLGNGTEPRGLDPHIVTGITERNIIDALLEGLVVEHPKTLEPMPGVAESWAISDDLKTYTFTLRKNALWSDGSPITAGDFVYSWRRLLSPALGSEYAYQLYYVKNAEAYNREEITDFNQVGVHALDDHTLQVELNGPTPFFLSLMAHHSIFPVHRPTIEKHGTIDEVGTLWTRPGNFVGNGPFILTEWALNRIIRVEKNPNYWDAENVRLNEIRFYPIDKATAEERMFRSKALHVTSTMPSEKIAPYQQNHPELIRISPYLGSYYYRFNVSKAPFDDVRVRRAFSMSIDRQKIVDAVTKGGQLPAFSYTPDGTKGYTSRTRLEYDVAAARKLLSDAGYPEGKGLPRVEILYNTSEGHRNIAVAIQQMWKKALGAEVTLLNQDWKVYLSKVRTGEFQMARAGWIGDYADPNTFLDMFVTDGGNNNTRWSSKRYDQLIRQAAITVDADPRYELFQQAETLLLEQSPIIPIYTYTSIKLISPDVKGWYPNIMDHHTYKFVYLERDAKVDPGIATDTH